MTEHALSNIEQLETDLWAAADNLRAEFQADLFRILYASTGR